MSTQTQDARSDFQTRVDMAVERGDHETLFQLADWLAKKDYMAEAYRLKNKAEEIALQNDHG